MQRLKKQFFLLCSRLLLFWYFNFCTPLDFDDYIYSYVWTAGNMERPLAETAQRVNSFKDIFQSQWNHYFTWGGRSVAHILLQFFLLPDDSTRKSMIPILLELVGCDSNQIELAKRQWENSHQFFHQTFFHH